jgi:hypothetical protein
MRLIPILLSLASSLVFSLCASAQDTADWGQVGGWRIKVDRTIGDGCFAMQVYEGGTVVRIGFDIAQQHIYLFFGDDDWTSLEEGKTYPIRVVFDGSESYDGEMSGVRLGNVVFLNHSQIGTDFVKDFMERDVMQIFYRGSQIANLSLRNTYAAVSEIIHCQRELGFASRNGGGSGSDPFSQGSRPKAVSDPFSFRR